MEKYIINKEDSGKRIDTYLIDILDISRSKIQKLLKKGYIQVNNKMVKNSYLLKKNDIINVDEYPEEEMDVKPEKMDLDIDVARLKVLKADHQSKVYRLEDQLLKYFPAEIEKYQSFIKGFEKDIEVVEKHPLPKEDFVGITVGTKHFTDKELAGEAILATCKNFKGTEPMNIGEYRGFKMELDYDSFNQEYQLTLKGNMSHRLTLGTDPRGNLIRMDNALSGIPNRLEKAKTQLDNLYNQQEAAKVEVKKPFPLESELSQKSARLAELDAALNMDEQSEVKQKENVRQCLQN